VNYECKIRGERVQAMCAAERHADDSGDTRPTVLVVDDDALNVDLLTVYLEEEG